MAVLPCTPSSGRDKICVVWDLRSHQATRTVPVFEVGMPGGRASGGGGLLPLTRLSSERGSCSAVTRGASA